MQFHTKALCIFFSSVGLFYLIRSDCKVIYKWNKFDRSKKNRKKWIYCTIIDFLKLGGLGDLVFKNGQNLNG